MLSFSGLWLMATIEMENRREFKGEGMYYCLNFYVPQNLYVKNNPQCNGTKRWGLWKVTRSQGNIAPFHHVRTQQEGTISEEWALTRYHICWHFEVGLLDPITMRNKFIFFRSSPV